MPKKPPPPKEMLETRPGAEDTPYIGHPINGPPIGRPPPNYTPAVLETIVRHIECGQRPQVAAALAGIPTNTFYRWMSDGKAGDPHLHEFYVAVERALAVAESKAVTAIAGSKGTFDADPDNAKWYLERTRPEGYSKDVAAKVHAELNAALEKLQLAFDPDTFDRIVAVLAGHSVQTKEPRAFAPALKVKELGSSKESAVDLREDRADEGSGTEE